MRSAIDCSRSATPLPPILRPRFRGPGKPPLLLASEVMPPAPEAALPIPRVRRTRCPFLQVHGSVTAFSPNAEFLESKR